MATFYLDEDVPLALAHALQVLGHVATTTDDAGRKHMPDHDQLWYAMGQRAILITANARDYYFLSDAWTMWGVPHTHPGVIALASPTPPEIPQIAAAVDAFVADPQAIIALQEAGSREIIPVNDDGTITNRFYYRNRDGFWGIRPPRRR